MGSGGQKNGNRMKTFEGYELILTPLASDIPVDVRLQALLKTTLRRFRFRCKSVKPVAPKAKLATKAKSKK